MTQLLESPYRYNNYNPLFRHFNYNVKNCVDYIEYKIDCRKMSDIIKMIELNKYAKTKSMQYNGDWALVESNGLLGFIDREGNEVVKPKYDI